MPTTIDQFPDFDLSRLLTNVFAPKEGERICILFDFAEPRSAIKDLAFLQQSGNEVQKLGYENFYQALHDGVLSQLKLKGGELFAYEETGGSNLDLPDVAYTPEGEQVSLEADVYPNYDIILCISNYSATAPLTAFCKKFGFRGATLHGLNPVILQSGLAVDYEEVSRTAEKMRLGMTNADAMELDFVVGERQATLRLELGQQEAQKSHGLCREGADVANLPAGEIYYVPTGAEGEFPLKFEDGSIGMMKVEKGYVVDGSLLSGSESTISEFVKKVQNDPAAGEIGELGFGTQELPVSGRDIQDEKILGTFHVATGRSDHLGGDITPDKFQHAGNATHDDILFSPEKTPEIAAPEVRMYRSGVVTKLIENYKATNYIVGLRNT